MGVVRLVPALVEAEEEAALLAGAGAAARWWAGSKKVGKQGRVLAAWEELEVESSPPVALRPLTVVWLWLVAAVEKALQPALGSHRSQCEQREQQARRARTGSPCSCSEATEDISESLKVSGVKALDLVERNVRQASRALRQGRELIMVSVAESKKQHGEDLLNKLVVGLEELGRIVEERDRDAVAPKQKELLNYVGGVEEDMVDGFPMKCRRSTKRHAPTEGKSNSGHETGNFVDLVERHFYDGMEIQRADGFVVQTGDPEGPAEGFIDPSTEKVRTIPLEIMVVGDKSPVYGATLEELGRYKAQTRLPFNAFGTMAMAREEFENNSASSQVFWLLKESELTPSNANILDGRYAVFGYVTENEGYLADLKVGDVVESIQVVSGLDNLVNPSYKIVG
ncbi:hypothetical protein HPP92_019517 [Vanilla planifolia]|uniref:peptidylprolyl isomerase n=1 Tax=Vanilla planifolia TaxID=51239 RepID=A0A835UL09_VANPL|nr:hypothetical protein HPP92_019517 [Vanilla planifolia]